MLLVTWRCSTRSQLLRVSSPSNRSKLETKSLTLWPLGNIPDLNYSKLWDSKYEKE
jgi:hypothetical protein